MAARRPHSRPFSRTTGNTRCEVTTDENRRNGMSQDTYRLHSFVQCVDVRCRVTSSSATLRRAWATIRIDPTVNANMKKNAMIDSRFHASKKRRSDFDVGNAGICVLICPYVQRDVTRILSPYNTTLPVHYAVGNVVNTSTYEIAARYAAACASSAVR